MAMKNLSYFKAKGYMDNNNKSIDFRYNKKEWPSPMSSIASSDSKSSSPKSSSSGKSVLGKWHKILVRSSDEMVTSSPKRKINREHDREMGHRIKRYGSNSNSSSDNYDSNNSNK